MLEEWLARSAYRSGEMKDVAKQLEILLLFMKKENIL